MLHHIVRSRSPFSFAKVTTLPPAEPPVPAARDFTRLGALNGTPLEIGKRIAITGTVLAAVGRQPELATAGAVFTAPLVALHTAQGAVGSYRHITRAYPATVAAAEKQRGRVEARRHAFEERPDASMQAALAHDQVRLGQLQHDRRHAAFQNVAGPAGVAVGAGYATALTAVGVRNVAALVGPSAAQVASTAGQAISAAAAPAQILMTLHQGAHAVKFVFELRGLERDREALRRLCSLLPPGTFASADAAMKRLEQYKTTDLAVAVVRAIGQGLSATGSILSLTVVGSPAGIPLTATGISADGVAALVGLASSHRYRQFTGHGASPSAASNALSPATAESIAAHGVDAAVERAARAHAANQETLVTTKLMSLVSYALDREARHARFDSQFDKPSNEHPDVDPERARVAAVAALARTGRKHALAGTSLLKVELDALKDRFDDLATRGFFRGTENDVRRRVAGELTRDQAVRRQMTPELRARVERATLRRLQRQEDPAIVAAVHVTSQSRHRVVSSEQLADLTARDTKADTLGLGVLSKTLIKQAKTDAKCARLATVREMVTLGHTQRLLDRGHAPLRAEKR